MRSRFGTLFPTKVKGVHLSDIQDKINVLKGRILDKHFFGNPCLRTSLRDTPLKKRS